VLRSLAGKTATYMRNRYCNEQEVVEVAERDLAEKARQISINNLQRFFNPEMFKANNFKYDSGRKLIVQTFYFLKPVTPCQSFPFKICLLS